MHFLLESRRQRGYNENNLRDIFQEGEAGMTKEQSDQFRAAVYRLVARIPAGKVATYGQLAAMLGQPLAARRVGDALRRTPEYLDIPTHRVVNRQGRLAPPFAFGGMGNQRRLLEQEGVEFRDNGCVDVLKHIW